MIGAKNFVFKCTERIAMKIHHMSLWAWASSTGNLNFDLDGFDLVDYRNQFAPVTTAEGLRLQLIRHWYKLYFLLALAHSTW